MLAARLPGAWPVPGITHAFRTRNAPAGLRGSGPQALQRGPRSRAGRAAARRLLGLARPRAPAATCPPDHPSDQQEEYDLDQKIDTAKLIDAEGAGRSMFSPGWLTQLNQLWGGKSVRAAPRRGWGRGCACQHQR